MKYKLIAVLSSLLLFSSFAFADGLIGIGSFESQGDIGNPEMRGVVIDITYIGPGAYEVEMSFEFTNFDDYVAIPTGWKSQETRVCDVDRQSKAGKTFLITCKDGSDNAADPKNVQFAIFRMDAEQPEP